MTNIDKQDFVAKLFLPNNDGPYSAVVVLGGSAGGFNEPAAEALARWGYAVLAVAYFGADRLSGQLENIPLESFFKAIQWLKAHPQIRSEQIHLHGVSRGGELAVLLASVFPNEIASTVAVVPSCVTYGGYPNKDKPAWTLNGKPLPIAPAPTIEDQQQQQDKYGAVNLTKLLLRETRDHPNTFNEALIKVERIKCPLLLVSGKDDRMWPSWLYGNMIIDRLEECGAKIFREHLCYENVGHMILPSSHAPVITEPFKHPVSGLLYEVGGENDAQAEANQDSWEKIVTFFDRFGSVPHITQLK